MPENRTVKALTKELIDNPFFPLLALAEFAKQLVEHGVYGGYTVEWAAITLVCMTLWVLSDAISVDVDNKKILGDD